MQLKTEKQIQQTFNGLTAHIINESAAFYLSETKLIFIEKYYSYTFPHKNTIYFSMPAYYRNAKSQSTLEYKKVLDRIKIPYYKDCAGNYNILTCVPEIYTLLHEISHIITHRIHKNASVHGIEFCDIYITLIEMFEPKTVSPITADGFITWCD